MAFDPINTQEEFDAAIAARIERERKKFEGYLSPEQAADVFGKKYEGYLSPKDVEKKYAGYLSPEQAAEKDAKLHKYETDSVKTRVALEAGLPFEMASRLHGEDEDAIREDAEALFKLMGPAGAPPLADPEPAPAPSKDAVKDAAYRDLTNKLTKSD